MSLSSGTSIASSANRTTLENLLAAFGRGDLEGLKGYLSPDVVLREPAALPIGGEHHGPDAFVSTILQLGEMFDIAVASYDIVDADEIEVCMIDVTFTSRATGRSARVPNVEVYRFADGLISDVDVYYKDTAALAAILEPVTRR